MSSEYCMECKNYLWCKEDDSLLSSASDYEGSNGCKRTQEDFPPHTKKEG